MNGFAAWDTAEARRLLGGFVAAPDSVLPMLHALQHRYGFIHAEAPALVAEATSRSRAEIHGVVTFYHDFRTTPPPARVIRLCRAEACQAVGSEALAALARSSDTVAVEAVYCLGNCALGPAALVDGHLVGHLDAPRLHALLAGADPVTLQAPPP